MYKEAIDFRYLLLENYKSLKMSEQEVATILMIDHYINDGNPFITADLLSLKMSLKVKDIDSILAGLFTKGFIEYINRGNEMITTLEPLKSILFRQFQINSSKEEINRVNEKRKESLSNIFGEYQKLLKRTLSPVEINKIGEWIDHGFTDKQIIDALKEALSKDKKSLRSVDKILLKWETRDDIEKEGVSSLREDWRANIEETIKIAKTPWVNIDDDDKE